MKFHLVQICIMAGLLIVAGRWADSQEPPSTPRDNREPIKIRRVYVPESELQRLIEGRYLPLKLEKLEELLQQVETPRQQNFFRTLSLHLKWSPESGWAGDCWIELGREADGNPIEFDSNLVFSNPRCLDSEFALPVTGRTLQSRSAFVAVAGSRFHCDVSVPVERTVRSCVLQLPNAMLAEIWITVPQGYQVVSDSPSRRSASIPVPGQEESVSWWVASSDSMLELSVVREDRAVQFVTTRDEITWGPGEIRWVADLSLPGQLVAGGELEVNFDSRFRCLAVTQQDRAVDFVIHRMDSDETVIRWLPVDRQLAPRTFRLVFESTIPNPLPRLEYRPLSVSGFGPTRADVQVNRSKFWEFDALQFSGFQLDEIDSQQALRLIQSQNSARLAISGKPRDEKILTERLEWDLQNEEILVRQLVSGLENQAVLKISEGWEIQSVVAVGSEEPSIGYSVRQAAGGERFIEMENEVSAVRVIGTRNVDPVAVYTCADFVPVPLGLDLARVQLQRGFLGRFGDGLDFSRGLPMSVRQDQVEWFRWRDLLDLRFQMTADNQSVETRFASTVEVEWDGDRGVVLYQVKWNSENQRRLIIELNAQQLERVTYNDTAAGFGQRLNEEEKRRLGLAVTREYWSFEMPAGEPNREGYVSFVRNLVASEQGDGVIELPRTIGKSVSSGLLKIRTRTPSEVQIGDASLIELPYGGDARQRVYQFAGQSSVVLTRQPQEPDSGGISFHVLDTAVEVLDQQRMVQRIGLLLRGPQSASERSGNVLRVSASESSIQRIVLRRGSVAAEGFRDNAREWSVPILEREGEPAEAVLEIAHVRKEEFKWEPFQIPRLKIEGISLEQGCDVLTAGDWGWIDFHHWRPDDFQENLRNLGFFPALGFDTQTVEQFLGKVDRRSSIELPAGAHGRWIFLVPQKTIQVGAILWFAMFCCLALILRRNRYALFGSLVFLSLSIVFGGIYGLLFSMSFWGFVIGMVVRELRRLCQFATVSATPRYRSVRAPSRSAVLLLVISGLTANAAAQEPLPARNEKDQPADKTQRLLPALIPVGENDEPTGIAYLPAELYSSLTTDRRAVGQIVVEEMTLEIRPDTNPEKLSATLRLSMMVDEPTQLQLPLVVDGGIYDAQAVTVDSLPALFRPSGTVSPTFAIRLPRSGRQKLEIDFQVPLANRDAVEISLPISGPLWINNRSAARFLLESRRKRGAASDASGQGLLSGSASQWFIVEDRLRLRPQVASRNPVTIVEAMDYSQSPATRQVLVVAEESFSTPFRFAAGNQSSLVNSSDQVSLRREEFLVSSPGGRRMVFEFEDKVTATVGAMNQSLFRSFSHPVAEHYVLFRGLERFQVEAEVPVMPVDRWNRLMGRRTAWRAPAEWTNPDLVLAPENGDAVKLWLNLAGSELNCLATHHYFVSRQDVAIESEFDISCSSPVTTIEVVLGTEFRNPRFTMGNRQLDWVRTGPGQVALLVDLEQAGRYLVEFQGEIPIEDDRIRLLEPKVDALTSRRRRHVWTGRHRRLAESLERESDRDSPRRGFVYAGSPADGIDELVSTPNESIGQSLVEETVQLLPGKTVHRLKIEVPNAPAGQWLGLEVPVDATLSEEEKSRLISEFLSVFDDSSTLGRKQIWVPIITPGTFVFSVELQQAVESNRVVFASLVNSASVERRIRLPEKINDRKLQWTIDEARSLPAEGEGPIWLVTQQRPTARYEVQSQGLKPLRVMFAEVEYRQQNGRLRSRFLVQPGDQGSLSLAIPENQLIESIKICGSERSWDNRSPGTIELRLLNNRFHQIVDLVTYPPGAAHGNEERFDLPQVQEAGDYPVYFQCRAGWMPRRWKTVAYQELVDQRADFVEQAVNNYELNLEQAEGWQGVIASWIGVLTGEQPIEAGLRERLENLPIGGGWNRMGQVGLDSNPCQPGTVIYRATSSQVHLAARPAKYDFEVQLRVLGMIAIAGGLALMTVRLPREIRTPMFSLLLISVIWVFGVAWISVTPKSIFAWCWLLFAALFVVLVVIDSILKLRAFRSKTVPNAAIDSDGSIRSGQTEESRPTV